MTAWCDVIGHHRLPGSEVLSSQVVLVMAGKDEFALQRTFPQATVHTTHSALSVIPDILLPVNGEGS
jgi:hypothetical protein